MQRLKVCTRITASKSLLWIGLGPAFSMESHGRSMLNLGQPQRPCQSEMTKPTSLVPIIAVSLRSLKEALADEVGKVRLWGRSTPPSDLLFLFQGNTSTGLARCFFH